MDDMELDTAITNYYDKVHHLHHNFIPPTDTDTDTTYLTLVHIL